MNYMKLTFPHNEEIELEFGKPIVVIGANGAGKTRFSVKIEEMNDPAFHRSLFEQSHIHRLSAQKSLNIDTTISIYDYESSERNLFLGRADSYAYKAANRYQLNPATSLINDYGSALSLLFSEAQKELQQEHRDRLECEKEGKQLTPSVETVVDKAERIWNKVLPHRKIDLSDNGVHVIFNGTKYHGKEMSDGERVMLYMICQALIVKPNSLFIIDEPELHIHKSIVNELWTLLENERQDCIFMYITHDIPFAMSRREAQYLWVKRFSGSDWDYEFIDAENYSDLPSELLIEILGTRQKILFVEGERSSFDYQLYQEIFRDRGYHVIPCSGCQEIIRLVKSKRTYEKLESIEVYGLIDRDFRSENEIEALKNDGIFCLNVAEVENLFVVPELLDKMEMQFGCSEGTAQQAKKLIIDLYNQQKSVQIAEAVSKEISFQLSLFEMGKKVRTSEEIKDLIYNKYKEENIEKWITEKTAIFDAATTIEEILKVFNCKELSKIIGPKFGMTKNDYPQRVLNLIANNKLAISNEILNILKKYVPELP